MADVKKNRWTEKVLGIIPARYSSTRFPGKPLIRIGEKSMIQWVYERSSSVLAQVVVATDDQRIQEEVKSFGGKVIMTDANHPSGTDRCREALDLWVKENNLEPDAVVNIQGDEPFIQTSQIEQLAQLILQPEVEIATLVKPISQYSDLINPNIPKVVLGTDFQALYFSRQPIPYLRSEAIENWLNHHTYYKHIGMYAYRSAVLRRITQLPKSKLEQAESLEQLRWLEHQFRIHVSLTHSETLAIDTPEDYQEALKRAIPQ